MDTLALITKVENLYSAFGYQLIFFSSLIEITPMGWIIPGGGILAIGGFFAYGTKVHLLGTIIAGWLGAWTAFLLAYFLGKKTGFWLVKKLKQEENAQIAKKLLNNHGGAILTTSMMANLTRFWVAYVAGINKYSFFKFLFYSGIASIAWVSLMITAGYLAGYERANLEHLLKQIGILAWFLLLLPILVFVRVVKKDRQKFKEGVKKNEDH